MVLGSRAEDAFRLSMISGGGSFGVFWQNWLVGSITTLSFVLLFLTPIERAIGKIGRVLRPAQA